MAEHDLGNGLTLTTTVTETPEPTIKLEIYEAAHGEQGTIWEKEIAAHGLTETNLVNIISGHLHEGIEAANVKRVDDSERVTGGAALDTAISKAVTAVGLRIRAT